jgi:surface protein
MKRQHAILTLIVAAMAVLTAGCQKEKESGAVTLTAEIQETLNCNGKVFINSNTPCWHNGDEVFINNAAYPVTAASGSLAQIENVVPANSYQAIFPAGIVAESSPNSDNSIEVTLPSMQTYRIADGRQQPDLPMGASLTSGNTLRFYSLCSVVRVTVHNQLNRELLLGGIKLKAKNAKLSGSGIATISRNAFDSISMSDSAQNNVRLDFTTDCPATVETQGKGTFDIVVPPFTTDNVMLSLYTPDGYMCEMVMEGMSLARNSIASVTLDVTALTEAPAELISGPAFNDAIPKLKNVSTVLFEYNSPVSSGTLLSTPDSPFPIYGNLDGTTWRVSTRASQIHANPNCSRMFESDYGLSADQHGRYYYEHLKLVEIDFGNRFITDNVTDMSYMFILSGELTSIDLSNFNTEKVTDMSGMFWCCWKLTRLDVSSFNTVNVTDMSEMFWGCESMTNLNLSHFDMSGVSNKQDMCSALSTKSGACTITCQAAVRTALEHGTDLPTSEVVFTWVTP